MSKEVDRSEAVDTLSRSTPMANFLKEQSGKLKGMSEQEFHHRYQEHARAEDGKREHTGAQETKDGDVFFRNSNKLAMETSSSSSSSGRRRSAAGALAPGKGGGEMGNEDQLYGNEGSLDRIVLKFTTISEAGGEAPSFTVGRKGASIGRDASNAVSIPSDVKLSDVEHAYIDYDETTGAFYLEDRDYDFGAGVRISSTTGSASSWELKIASRFSVGNSVFVVTGMSPGPTLELKALEGVCKGKHYVVNHTRGALLGRSSENTIAVPDRELSRKHSQIEYDADRGAFFLSDCGSTNGTYILITGPYSGRYRLSLNDHILVGRTGFSINRYDYGISEEMGFRQTMEDSCVIVQHLGVVPLNVTQLCPQSFFGVFDGHGGAEAARYLSHHLHVNVAEALKEAAPEISSIMNGACSSSSSGEWRMNLRHTVTDLLKRVFVDTDDRFLETSDHKAHGSTATTVLIVGNELFCANVGDSRVLIANGGKGIYLTEDHKPGHPNESKRIKEAGGFVIHNRVMGELAVSRAFGDADFKQGISLALQEEGMELPSDTSADFEKPLIIAEPDVQCRTLEPGDHFIVLGCDGLFDVFQADEVVAFVAEELARHADVQKAASALTHEAIRQRNSRDNVSVIIVVLKD